MEKIKALRKLFNQYKIDGYIIPKNDEFFGEYVSKDKEDLKFISNFSGSYGFALILKNKNYLFVDGRYTLQANIQCGKDFKILTIPQYFPADILKNKKISIGYNSKLYTRSTLQRLFQKTECRLLPIQDNLITRIWKRPFINRQLSI